MTTSHLTTLRSPDFCVAHTLPAARLLPRARLEVSLAHRSGRYVVDVVYLRMVGRSRTGIRQRGYDDGFAVVDRNGDGEIVGLEFAYPPKRAALPEFLREVRQFPDAERQLADSALETAIHWWAVYARIATAFRRHRLAPPPDREARAFFDLGSAAAGGARWRLPARPTA